MKMPARPATLPTSTTTTVVLAKNDETEKRNTDAFRATAEAFGKGDSKAFAAMLADDYVLIDVTQPKDLNKKQALAGMAEYKKGFPDAVLTIATLWAAGDYVVAEGAFTGTNTGDLPSMKIKKTGKKVNVKFFEIIQFENGKAKKDWTIFNGADFASQLGLK
jgi:predicted ester cyclase